MKKNILITITIVAVLAVGYLFYQTQSQVAVPAGTQSFTPEVTEDAQF